ncbi:MAG: hypothetical protein FJW35_01410, partial [Acidobacteria bacterium]|nr:hypothetical protein [Acidobacteriota bacterium]
MARRTIACSAASKVSVATRPMMKIRSPYRKLMLGTLLILPALVFALGPAPPARQGASPESSASAASGGIRLIVELDEPGVVESLRADEAAPVRGAARSAAVPRVDIRSARAAGIRARLAQAQQRVRGRMASLGGIEVFDSVDVIMNALFVRAPAGGYDAIRRLPGVKKVYPVRELVPHLDAAAGLHRAQGMWDPAGGDEQAGRGVRIGIIDSGIDIDHPMFADSVVDPPPGFPKGETAFTTRKVIAARNYIHLLSRIQTVNTALDERGHGTFVAGCAAGRRAAGPLATVSGMAPAAFLGSYKVFGTPGINDTATNTAVIKATEDAVADGMDILNYSLGSLNYVPPSEDPLAIALNNAIGAGVVVVGSAGNSGPGAHTVGSPHSNPNTITVGAVTNSRAFAPLLRVTAPQPVPGPLQNIPYEPSADGPQVSAKTNPTTVVDVATLDGNGLACSPLPIGSLEGKIAFVARGDCFFRDKVSNAEVGRAAAVVVYNNVAGADPIAMGQMSATTIPAVMISNPNGLAMKALLAGNPGSTQLEIDPSSHKQPYQTSSRVITDFSSRGPGSDYFLKPDIVAVGENVYSAAQNNDPNGSLYSADRFVTAGGTSFSAPMVAGAAAVIRQLRPGLSPLQVKSVLVNTAGRSITLDGVAAANILEGGAGLLDMTSAAAAMAAFNPPTMSFGARPYTDSISLRKTLEITNFSGSPDSFALSIEQLVPGVSVSLSQVETGSIAAGGSTSVEVTLQATAPATGAFQGFLVARSLQSSAMYRIPYWAGLYVPDPTRTLIVRQGAGSGSHSSLLGALRAARPGNVIEIQDSGSYAGGLEITSNGEGLPLDGITIRAAAGRSPVIDGTAFTDVPNIRIVALENVLLQGLSLVGGRSAVSLDRYASSRPASLTVDRCVISNPAGRSGRNGVIAEDGGSVSVTKSAVSGFTGAGITASGGAQLNVVGSTIESNGFGGIYAADSDLLVLNTVVRNNVSAGIYLDDCNGTVEKCTVTGNRTFPGDGIRIGGGKVTVVDTRISSNERAGVTLWAGGMSRKGTTALLSGNTIESNAQDGVWADNAAEARVERNLIKGNRRGVMIDGPSSVMIVNNIIIGSTDPNLGDGIRATGSSRVQSIHNTVYRNGRRGLFREPSAVLTAVNTISAANTAGDASGLSSSEVRFSLIGDGGLTGNNNVAGDPRFADPGADVLTPGAGSPAVDAGTNAADSLPFLDFSRRMRVASVG